MKEKTILLLPLLIILVFLSFIATVSFKSYPYSMDEYSTVYQAKLFASGNLYAKFDSSEGVLREMYNFNNQGKVYSKYPPGSAVLFSLGIIMGIMPLINPIISTLSALFLFLIIKNIINSKIAWLTLAIMATNVYFIGYAASHYSQPLSLFLSVVSFYYLSLYLKNGGIYSLITCGLCIGMLFLVRQLDAFCLGCSISTAIAIACKKRQRILSIVILFFSVLPGIASLLLYNYLQSGKISISLTNFTKGQFVISFPESKGPIEYATSLSTFFAKNWGEYTSPMFFDYLLPFLGIAIFIPFLAGILNKISVLKFSAVFYIFLIVILYTLHSGNSWPVYGARYWYPALGAFFIITADGLNSIYMRTPRKLFIAAFLLLIGLQIRTAVIKLSIYERRFALHDAIYRDIEKTCPEKSIVIIINPPGLFNIHDIKFFNWWDFKRNPYPFGSRLYVLETDSISDLKNKFSDHSLCNYDFRKGNLRRDLPGFPSAASNNSPK